MKIYFNYNFSLFPSFFYQYVYLFFMYFLLVLFYVSIYTAFEFDSPSLSILRFISNYSDLGINEEDLNKFIEEHPFIDSRLKSLIRDGFIKKEEENIYITQRGKRALFYLDSYRYILLSKKVV